MMKNLLFILYLLPFIISSQEIKGKVFENNDSPVVGANVYWVDKSGGTVTDIGGNFKLENPNNIDKYVISYIGFLNDTLSPNNENQKIYLQKKLDLDEVKVTYNSKTSSVSLLSSANILNISSEELLKAACCNLAESFETTPSIDVNFSDAISGRKQIKMLGLSSQNLLMSIENIPSIRGA